MVKRHPSLKKTNCPPLAVVPGSGAVPDLHLASWLPGEVRYISDQSFHLVLYVSQDCRSNNPDLIGPFASSSHSPQFKNPSEWKLLFHQTAGYLCRHRSIYARFLDPRPAVKKLGATLLSKYNDSLVSQPLSLSAANEYDDLLRSHGLTASNSYVQLEEGFYPIDLECLSKVAKEKMSKDLRSQFIEPMSKGKKKSISDIFGNWVNFELAILGPNCD